MLDHILKDPNYKILKKKKIGVLMGGRSAEREVSLQSGKGALAALRRLGFTCAAIDAASNLEKKLISPEDLDIFRIIDDPEEVAKEISRIVVI